MDRFVTSDFPVPAILEHEHFFLRMLRADDAQADYEAVMASQERLRAGSPHGWPRPGFTLAENRADLVRHEQEFHDRVAFAYTVVSPDGARTLGCVYINPPATSDTQPDSPDSNGNPDAFVYLWVRDEDHAELSGELFRTVDAWLDAYWPFQAVRYIRTEYYLNGDQDS